jgi:hypothetical protein
MAILYGRQPAAPHHDIGRALSNLNDRGDTILVRSRFRDCGSRQQLAGRNA